MRKIERGLRTMFGSEPFAGTITERPTGMTSCGGTSCRPSRGCNTRVKLPGGSLPMILRVSMPRRSNACACNSACSTTAPQKDHEYGTTIPTFTGGEDMATPTLRRVIGRLLAAALAIGLVVLAAAVESGTARLSAKRTETQVAKRYSPDTT